MPRNSIISRVTWSNNTRSCVVMVSPGTPTTVIANLTSRAIIELAALRKPSGCWGAEETTVHTNYAKGGTLIEVSLTR